MKQTVQQRLAESAAVITATADVLSDPLVGAVELVIDSYRQSGGVYAFGNGGSAADAQHIACELVGRFLQHRRALRAVALHADTSTLTAVANDYDFDRIYCRQLEALARPGDVAIGLSTSGNSPNVVAALQTARELGCRTIAFTGQGGGRCADLADVLLAVPAQLTPRVQEAHMALYHILCELVERAIVAEGI